MMTGGHDDYGPASNRIIPISIRPDVVVRIADLPFDMTRQEAEKIAAVVIAYAQGDTP